VGLPLHTSTCLSSYVIPNSKFITILKIQFDQFCINMINTIQWSCNMRPLYFKTTWLLRPLFGKPTINEKQYLYLNYVTNCNMWPLLFLFRASQILQGHCIHPLDQLAISYPHNIQNK
jgi:hypothetical protein